MRRGICAIICALMVGYATADFCEGRPDYTRGPIDAPIVATNCDKYNECENNVAVPKTCPPGFAYLDSTKKCTWRNDVAACGENVPVKSPVCTAPSTKIADVADCHYYYTCDADLKKSAASVLCADDKIFDPFESDCVASTDYYCVTGPGKPDCDIITQTFFLPMKDDCSGYYICDDGSLYIGSCKSGFIYNPQTRKCDYESNNVYCSSKTTTGGGSLGSICKDQVGNFVADPDMCTAYYYCRSATLPVHAFCSEGTYFQEKNCVKTPPSNCNCESIDWDATEEPYVNVKAPAKNEYYKCSNIDGKPTRVLKTCKSGFNFDAITGACK